MIERLSGITGPYQNQWISYCSTTSDQNLDTLERVNFKTSDQAVCEPKRSVGLWLWLWVHVRFINRKPTSERWVRGPRTVEPLLRSFWNIFRYIHVSSMRMTLLIRFFSGIMFCVKIAYLGLMLLTVWRYSEVLIFFLRKLLFSMTQNLDLSK